MYWFYKDGFYLMYVYKNSTGRSAPKQNTHIDMTTNPPILPSDYSPRTFSPPDRFAAARSQRIQTQWAYPGRYLTNKFLPILNILSTLKEMEGALFWNCHSAFTFSHRALEIPLMNSVHQRITYWKLPSPPFVFLVLL